MVPEVAPVKNSRGALTDVVAVKVPGAMSVLDKLRVTAPVLLETVI